MIATKRRTRKLGVRIAAAACGVLILGACGDPGNDATTLQTPGGKVTVPTASAPTPGNAIQAGDAKVAISSPKEGDTVSKEIEVVTDVQGFDVVDKIGDEAKEGEGHLIYYLGRGYQAPVTLGQSAVSGGSGAFVAAASAETTYTWKDVQPGPQTLTAQLVNNDNTPLDPPQLVQVSVEVEG